MDRLIRGCKPANRCKAARSAFDSTAGMVNNQSMQSTLGGSKESGQILQASVVIEGFKLEPRHNIVMSALLAYVYGVPSESGSNGVPWTRDERTKAQCQQDLTPDTRLVVFKYTR